MARLLSPDSGFSLLETLVAVGLLVAGVTSLAQLLGLAYASNVAAERQSMSAILAAQKIEELRSIRDWTSGIDFLDDDGVRLASGGEPPGGTAYTRRWTVEALPADPVNSRVAEVTVFSALRPRDDGVRFVAVQTRRLP